MAKTLIWRKLWSCWRSVLSPSFWFWTLPRQPSHSLGIVVLVILTSYIDLRELRHQGEPMD